MARGAGEARPPREPRRRRCGKSVAKAGRTRSRWGPRRSRSRRRMEGAVQTDRIIGISLLIVGVALLFAGLNATESISSEFSKLFQGVPSDKAIWLMVGGA